VPDRVSRPSSPGTRAAGDLHLVCTWFAPECVLTSPPLAGPFAPGLHLDCARIGISRGRGAARDLHLAYAWLTPGLRLAYAWLTPGLRLSSRGRGAARAGRGRRRGRRTSRSGSSTSATSSPSSSPPPPTDHTPSSTPAPQPQPHRPSPPVAPGRLRDGVGPASELGSPARFTPGLHQIYTRETPPQRYPTAVGVPAIPPSCR
jgi:hypothetical protein